MIRREPPVFEFGGVVTPVRLALTRLISPCLIRINIPDKLSHIAAHNKKLELFSFHTIYCCNKIDNRVFFGGV